MSEPTPDHIPTKEEENEELRSVFPLFKNWKSLYAFVLGELLVLIVLFYLFSRAYS